ncbi:efflux RND transporter periplasmic adaptor subunit [Woeseia oceani]|uniref:Uncharacterized protein n=1 Tax=Woeseia oceani TaxID=1548547 RepID=A0A193LDH7_9GAMM|nr:efflux RND transporter periplasmic adaptor subunit [Woeseia oceani]ANO50533.1 hypothetical protein BA177_04270 [Woeseia oceani]
MHQQCTSRWLQAAALSASLCLSLAASLPASAQQAPLETMTVKLAEAPLERYYDGTVEAVNQATVSAQTSGRIAEILVDVDDYAEAGTLLMRFTSVEQMAALAEAQASLTEALARARASEEEFSRAKSLLNLGSGSRREFDQAEAARDSAKARVVAARSAVARAQQQVDYTEVRAPYAGIVTERHVEAGESVNAGQPLMSGLSLESLRVIVDLPQDAASALRKEREAAVVTSAGRIVPTEIVVFPYADATTNTFRARLSLPDGQFNLYPGMYTKVVVNKGTVQRLLIPATALVRRSEVSAVYVMDANGKLRLRQVRTGNRPGDSIEVLAGLEAGERIALDPVKAGIQVKTQMSSEYVE